MYHDSNHACSGKCQCCGQCDSRRPRTYLQISKSALRSNLNNFKNLLPDKKIYAVVKANAYGHGVECVVPAVEDLVAGWQVDSLAELQEVRVLSDKPVLVLGYVPRRHWTEVWRLGGIMNLISLEQLVQLQALADYLNLKTPIQVHLKLDMHLGRQGLLLSDLDEFIRIYKQNPNFKISGVYTHFARADEEDLQPTWVQIADFKMALLKLDQADVLTKDYDLHLSATAGALVYEYQSAQDESESTSSTLIRLGLGMYGLWPSALLAARYANSLDLQPVLTWKSEIAQVKTLPVDYPIGYGGTYQTTTVQQVAVVPVGYADGYDRGLSNQGEVLINGQRCAVLGRVAMNMIMVDLQKVKNVKVGDEVVLLGQQASATISAEELATKLATINYEIPTRLNVPYKEVV